MIHNVIGDDEIEERFQLGIAMSFGGLGIVFCDHLEKMINVLAAHRPDVLLSEELLKTDQYVSVA